MASLRHVLLLVVALAAAPAFAQTAPAPGDNMQTLRQKLIAGKKEVVKANMDLTDAEAKAFWPLYEAYQKQMQAINERIAATVVEYSKLYGANTLTDAKAIELMKQVVAIESDTTKLKSSFMPKLMSVLPGRKVARYMQIENKIHVLVMYEIAAEVPLAP